MKNDICFCLFYPSQKRQIFSEYLLARARKPIYYCLITNIPISNIEYIGDSFSAVLFCFLVSNLSDLCKYLVFENENIFRVFGRKHVGAEQEENRKGIVNYYYESMRTQIQDEYIAKTNIYYCKLYFDHLYVDFLFACAMVTPPRIFYYFLYCSNCAIGFFSLFFFSLNILHPKNCFRILNLPIGEYEFGKIKDIRARMCPSDDSIS